MVDKSDGVRNHFVYRYFDAAGDLLYVGCSHRPAIRWAEHKTTRPGMCAAVTKVKISGPYCYTKAREIERAAIRTERPLCGWTPDKQREKVLRSKWIDERISTLRFGGVPYFDAVKVAVAEAEDVWPDPMRSPYDPPPAPAQTPA